MHTANLALRFFLELAALTGFSVFAWSLTEGFWRFIAVGGTVLLLGVIWATFAVPDDPSRSGNAPLPVPGTVRLILEWAVLFGGAWAFYATGYTWPGFWLAALTVVHYLLWPSRIAWLLQN
ncbi:YrdB family protein [uncultured Aliiroseovarius sp.]|uniref:YrdB family protein n=1 Tax=uncultured Aliiroseovarius sp. TaxID=1658783 RepID=UPI0026019630|nr:YrdB family protein [uncultured Aliiroseovarius sp.]